jgi:hypothetical protein
MEDVKAVVLKTAVFIFKFLVSGNFEIAMSFSYRIAPSTVHYIIISTCEATWNKLPPTELPQPTGEMWEKKSGRILFVMAVHKLHWIY